MRSHPIELNRFKSIAIRISVSALIWCGFGIVVGICTAPKSDLISMIAGILAGMIVLTPVGVVTSVFGGRWTELLIGGGMGYSGGVALAILRGEPCGYLAGLGLVFGGLVGATVVSAFWRLPRLLKRLVFAPTSASHVKQPVLT